jgi:hypothetical protein
MEFIGTERLSSGKQTPFQSSVSAITGNAGTYILSALQSSQGYIYQ